MLLGAIPWDIAIPGASVTLLAGAVWMVLTGRLVPGKERDHWRDAFFTEQEMRRDLEATGRVVRTAFKALPESPPEDQ